MGGLTGSTTPFGSAGAPGFISPFDQNQFGQGAAQSIAAMTHQYQNLGLDQHAASPTGPAVGAKAGVPGSGTTPTAPGSFGAGSTAYQMDVGAAPSTTGGIPAEFEAGLGQQQTQDLSQTASSALSAIRGKNQQTGVIGSGLGTLGSLAP